MQINRLITATAVASILALAACDSEPETINGINDPMAEELKKAPPVKELPPSISHNRTYRCSDNSLVYVDFYTNNTALLRTRQGGDPVTLTAEGGNPPYLAEGHSVSANADSVRITAPGKNNLSCHT